MIRDVDQLEDGAVIHAEVGVVGAGFAGIDLALRLGGAGVRVALLESGGLDFDPAVQQLAREDSVGKPVRAPSPDSPFTPYLPARFRGESRLRQFGGTSNIWTGKWRRFDAFDLAERPWIPASGWPIGYDELARYYARVGEEYGLGDAEAFERRPEVRRARQRLAEHGLDLSFHYWEAAPTRPGVDRREQLEASDTIEVHLGASATEIVLDDAGETVANITFRTLDGRTVDLVADRFVLATGGLEAPRLLLASNRQRLAGIGNEHGLVGRFHMDHPKSKRATLHPGPELSTIEPWTRTGPRPRFHVSIELADEVQRELAVLDHAVYLSPVYRYQVGYPDAEVSALRDAVRTRRLLAALRAAGRLLLAPRSVARVLQRTWYRDRGGPVAHYTASMYVEQAPNPDSRLGLADEVDAVGVPRLVVDWRLNDLDRRSFETVLAELARRLEAAGLGKLDLGTEEPSLDTWVDAAHHIGATRMSSSPEDGVVDPDGRVFGTDNLYVASSSIFPTGHSAAPTLTILALTARLADHLLATRRPREVSSERPNA